MAGAVQVTKTGPRSYTPAEVILGGQLVEARAAGRIGVCAAGSVKCLGVALTNATSPELVVTDPVLVGGVPVLNAIGQSTTVAVAYGGIEVPVTYSAAAAFGDKLVATSNGRVGPAGATPDARTIVGVCSAPAGVATNAVGLMRTL